LSLLEQLPQSMFEKLSIEPEVMAAIPAYNEDRFIGSVVLKAKQYVDVVVVIDDGSSDDTAMIAERAGALVIRHDSNGGKGEALNTAFKMAREMGVRSLVLVDADGQHQPDEIPLVLAQILDGTADMVVGSRYLEVKSSVPMNRRMGHMAVTALGNIGSGIFLTDSQNGFRAFSRRAIEVMRFGEAGFSVESEMQFIAKQHGLRVREAPITITYKDKAKRNVFAHGLWVLNGILRLIGQHRPLLFFGIPGMMFLFMAAAFGISVVSIYSDTGQLAIGYALITVMVGLLGSLSLFTGIILHSVRALIIREYKK